RAEDGGKRPLFGEPRERVGNEGKDVELHGARRIRLPRVCETGCDEDAPELEVYVAYALLYHRQRDAGVELEDVVRDTRRDVGDAAEPPPAVLFHVEADELEDVVLVRPDRAERLLRHLERSPAVEPDDRPAPRVLRLADPRRLAHDEQFGTDRETTRVLAGVLDEEGAGQSVGLPDTADGDAFGHRENAASASSAVGRRMFSAAS